MPFLMKIMIKNSEFAYRKSDWLYLARALPIGLEGPTVARAGLPSPGISGRLQMGQDAPTKIANMLAGLEQGLIAPSN
jgi:hypothetical protein